MLKPYRKTSYEDVVAHGMQLIREISEVETFYTEVLQRAEELGVAVEFSLRHTTTEEYRGGYMPPKVLSGRVPRGYALEIWIDLCQDGCVLASCEEEASRIQYSINVAAVTYAPGLVFDKVDFLSVEDVLRECVILEEFLDGIQEKGATKTPFSTNDRMPDAPMGALLPVLGVEGLEAGSYVELQGAEYDGAFGKDDSLFVGEHAFLPYKLLLLGLVPLTDLVEGDHITLRGDVAEAFLARCEELKLAIAETNSYTDALYDCGVAAYAPPPNAERLLNALCVFDEGEFEEGNEVITRWMDSHLGMGHPITIIW